MNRFEKFLDECGIARGNLHSAAERASYFVWYHIRATGEPEADLEVIAAYLKESGTPVPDLYSLYGQLTAPGQLHLVKPAAIPGRLRMMNIDGMDADFRAKVFESKGLEPLYFFRTSGGAIVRVGSRLDWWKYWQQKSWKAAWLMFLTGVIVFVFQLFKWLFHAVQQ